MNARGTDWSLALLVAVLVGTGALTAFAGTHDRAWVFALHDGAAFALGAVLVWKLRRVWRRVVARRVGRRGRLGVAAAALVAVTLATGWGWAAGVTPRPFGYTLLSLHDMLGLLLGAGVLAHAFVRARAPLRRDLADRRQLLASAGVALGAFAAWRVQRPAERLLGVRGARRRFTGSYDAASFAGNAFPTTSWVADAPRPLDPAAYRLTIAGAVRHAATLRAEQLDAGDSLTATLDCTGGFASTQRWRGTSLDRLLAGAGAHGDHVRVVSVTGYRWSFAIDDARAFLLATHVGDEPLAHGHGAPLRLVAPGRRGFQWIKWVTRVEVHDGPDPGAAASTVWSSFTAAGSGA